MISGTSGKLHWNYFLALERDLEVVSRYIEFTANNFDTYSIELAHLLFAAASEVDVVAKLLCQRLSPTAPHRNIDDYRAVISAGLPSVFTEKIHVPRYGLVLTPWHNWSQSVNPDWWRSYNNVKHQRDSHFQEATLKNALNALGALLLLTFHHYRFALSGNATPLSPKDTTRELKPESTLLQLPGDHYYGSLLIG